MARKPGLGKGLSALIPEAPEEVTVAASATTDTGTSTTTTEVIVEGPLRRVPVSSIRPNQYQPRKSFDEESLQALALSVGELGVLQPIIVRAIPGEAGQFELIAGERRWRAAGIAKLETVPVLVQDDVNDLLSLEQAVVENLHRVDLHALEEAAAYQQLIQEFNMTHEQVAQRVGKSRAYITNTLRLLQLGEAGQNALAGGLITAGHAKVILAISDLNAQATMVARVVKNEMSVRSTEEAIKAFLEPRPAGTATGAVTPGKPVLRPVPDPSVAELERLLEDYLDTRVHIDLKDRNSRVIIDFADLDDLERIYVEITKPR